MVRTKKHFRPPSPSSSSSSSSSSEDDDNDVDNDDDDFERDQLAIIAQRGRGKQMIHVGRGKQLPASVGAVHGGKQLCGP